MVSSVYKVSSSFRWFHAAVSYLPYLLTFGKEACLPLDQYFGISAGGALPEIYQYTKRLKEDLVKACPTCFVDPCKAEHEKQGSI